MKRGDVVFRQKGNLVASVWKDRRLVYVISSNTNPTVTTCQRKEKDGSTSSLTVPDHTAAYNRFMGGVDRSDQLRSY
jgi:mRNA-degrading endonuclease toxin of MazEF toxin-antitoxin module